MDSATVAAFTAAGLSLANVLISARLTGRSGREQWRRDQERPVVARALTLSASAARLWWTTSVAVEDGPPGEKMARPKDWYDGRQSLADLRYEVAQLDLLASSAVREAACELVAAHQKETTRLVLLEAGEEDFDARQRFHVQVQKLEATLVEQARTDLGLGPGGTLPVPRPRSLIGLVLARLAIDR